MISVFVIIEAANDLYGPLANNLKQLIYDSKSFNNIKLRILYKVKKDPGNYLWNNNYISDEYKDNNYIEKELYSEKYLKDQGNILVVNGKITLLDSSQFFKTITIKNRKIKIMSPDRFLKRYLDDKDINIVIIGGHGGPFQSLLDMEVSPMVSLNTVLFCKRINSFKIDFIFFDMCAMNYMETIYEILYKGKIKNIITYGNNCPFNGVYYSDFIKTVINYFHGFEEEFYSFASLWSMMIITQESVKKIEHIKELQCRIVKDILTVKYPDFDSLINEIDKSLINIPFYYKGKANERMINYIKFYLNNEDERKLYTQYEITKNNLWRFLITKSKRIYNDFNPECIVLEKSSIENLVYIHNSSLSQKEVDIKVNRLINIRREDDIY